MGIINVTPDSFSDGGSLFRRGHLDLGAVVALAERMLADGAAVLDVGGESTRPGAHPVGVLEECRRVMPVVERLSHLDTIVSVDTSKAEVATQALAAGCHLLNDVCALNGAGMLEAAAGSKAAVCLMHMRADPRSMQDAPEYDDVVEEVRSFLGERVAACRDAGIEDDRLLLDPGFGFGKTFEHNATLLNNLNALRIDGLPMLVGLSRKRMIGALTGRPVDDRVAGGVAAAVLAVLNGAAIVRSHDVAATVDALKVVDGITALSAKANWLPKAN
jgi:dihydropteroate synthase